MGRYQDFDRVPIPSTNTLYKLDGYHDTVEKLRHRDSWSLNYTTKYDSLIFFCLVNFIIISYTVILSNFGIEFW